MAENIVAVAAGEIGYTEYPAGSNRTRYGAWYGLDGEPWCMMFVQWCFDRAGARLPYKTASCSALLNWYRARRPDRVFQDPRPGDIVIYRFGHTGIVERVEAGTVTVIEGNTSPGEAGSQDNGGGVYRRTRKRSLAEAYIRPLDAAEQEENMTGKEIYDALQDYLAGQPVPAWAEKELEEAVTLGITDGKNASQLITRYQAAIMALRAVREREQPPETRS